MKKKITRVLLVNPFCVEEEYDVEVIKSGGQLAEDPIGLRYLVSYLRKNNSPIEVEIYDANLQAITYLKNQSVCDINILWMMLKDEIARFRPDMVGVSCLFHFSSVMAHKICAQVKSISNDIITVMGGVYPTVSFDEALKDPSLDYAILSEGGVAFSGLITALNNGEDPAEKIDGFAFRNKNNGIVNIPKKTFIDLGSVLWPDRKGTQFYTYRPRHYIARALDPEKIKIATIVGSRGCPWKCSFCSARTLWGSIARYRNTKDIAREMKYLNGEFGINAFIFNDDNITVNKEFILSLCRSIIELRMKIRWVTGSGIQVSSLTDEVVEAMYGSGFAVFNLGIETGSIRTMQRIGKPLRLDIVPETVRRIRRYGDGYVIGMFIIGFPFETKEDIRDTLKFMTDLDSDWNAIYSFHPFPGTADYDYCVERGYINKHGFRHTDFTKSGGVSTEHFISEYVYDEGYLANLKINFINNRNLRKGNIERAKKDFKYVLNIDPRHAVAHYMLGKSHELTSDKDKAAELFNTARRIASSVEKWKRYFDRLGINA